MDKNINDEWTNNFVVKCRYLFYKYNNIYHISIISLFLSLSLFSLSLSLSLSLLHTLTHTYIDR